MLHRDELDKATLNYWTRNFENEPEKDNIFRKFHDLQIYMDSDTFKKLSHSDTTHIRIYMGLDENSNAKLVAISAYLLDTIESLSATTYADMPINNQAYDLVASEWVDVDVVKKWTQKWYDTNKGMELYKTAFLFPRADFIQLFERDACQKVRMDFGLQKQIKPIVIGVDPSYSSSADETRAYDFGAPCPPVCDDYSPVIPDADE